MLRLRMGVQADAIELHCFLDADSGDSYSPDEYKLVKLAIKEGHYIEAKYSEAGNEEVFLSSQVTWINSNRFKTRYKAYKYK